MTIQLNPITNPEQVGGFNANFEIIENYINDNLLNRDGVSTGEPNHMEEDLDMNGNAIYNLPAPTLQHQAARLQDVQNAISSSSANLVSFTPYGYVDSTNVQGAIQEIIDTPFAGTVTTSTGTQTLTDALDSRANREETLTDTTLTVYVPSDYGSVQQAIDELSTISTRQGTIINVIIESGHQPATGVLVQDGDYSHFYISSEDAEVTLAATFPAVDVIKGVNARMPVLNCLINADSRGTNGYFADQASSGFVTVGSGIKYCNRQACYANAGSSISADFTVWTFSSQEAPAYSGILAWSSQISAQGADVSNSNYYGAQAAAGGTLNFRSGIADGAARHGVRATNAAIVNARSASSKNTGITGFRAFDCGIIHASSSDASGSVSNAYLAEHGGLIVADLGVASAGTSALVALEGSRIVATGFTSTSGSIRSDNNSDIALFDSNITAAGTRVLNAAFGSRITVNGGNISGGDGERAINIVEGSSIMCRNANLTASSGELYLAVVDTSEMHIINGTHNFPNDSINCLNGSLIRLHGSGILATTVPGMANAVLYGRGIIWGAS